MARPPKLKSYAIVDPDPETLGPAMLALTPIRRRFARGYVAAGGENPTEVARASGYSDVGGGSKVRACLNLADPKVVAAIKEEAGRTFDLQAVKAISTLGKLVGESENEKVRLAAATKILDRVGFGPKTTIHAEIDIRDNRSTGELLDFVRQLVGGPKVALPVIEGEVVTADG